MPGPWSKGNLNSKSATPTLRESAFNEDSDLWKWYLYVLFGTKEKLIPLGVAEVKDT